MSPDAILCEGCGYDCTSIADEASHCPECGRAMAENRHERRTGSAWQRSPSLGTFLRVGLESIVRPTALLSNLRLDSPHDRTLRIWSVALWIPCVVLIAAHATVVDVTVRETFPTGGHVDHERTIFGELPLYLLMTLIVLGLDLLTTAATYRRWKGWRITPAIHRAVSSHTLVPLVLFWIWLALTTVLTPFCVEPLIRWVGVPWAIPAIMAANLAGFALAFGASAYSSHTGYRINRFANGPRLERTVAVGAT